MHFWELLKFFKIWNTFWNTKSHVVFCFCFSFVRFILFSKKCPGLCMSAFIEEKNKSMEQEMKNEINYLEIPFSKYMVNFIEFCRVISSSINFFFLKSGAHFSKSSSVRLERILSRWGSEKFFNLGEEIIGAAVEFSGLSLVTSMISSSFKPKVLFWIGVGSILWKKFFTSNCFSWKLNSIVSTYPSLN